MKRVTVSNFAIIITILLWVLLLTACSSVPVTPTITPTETVPATVETEGAANETGAGELISKPSSLQDIPTIIAQRTPLPTPTPGPVDRIVEEAARKVGGAEISFLGLTAEDWINLGVWALTVIIAYLLVVWLLFRLIRWAVRRTKTKFDDILLERIGREIKWLILIIIVRLATLRLVLLSDYLRSFFDDLFFLLILGVIYIIALRLVSLTAEWYEKYQVPDENRKQLAPTLVTFTRIGYVLVSTIALANFLNHFGVELTVFSVVVLLLIVLLTIGARAAVADAISGFIILVDQPFRVGDVVFIKELDTRGEVVEIGIRTTHLTTGDGRQVLIPNSLISTSQVVNYSYPDPSFRVQIDFLTAGTNIEQVKQIIEETVRGVDGVLPDRSIDVFYLDLGGSGKGVRVRWWIGDVNDQNRILDRVTVALDRALEEAGIDTPDPAYELNLKAKGQTISSATQGLSGENAEESPLAD